MKREDVIKKIEEVIEELEHYDYQMDIYREGDDLFKIVDKDDNVFDVVVSYTYTNLYVFSVEGYQKYSLEDIDDIYLYMNINGNLSIRLNANNAIYTLVG